MQCVSVLQRVLQRVLQCVLQCVVWMDSNMFVDPCFLFLKVEEESKELLAWLAKEGGNHKHVRIQVRNILQHTLQHTRNVHHTATHYWYG